MKNIAFIFCFLISLSAFGQDDYPLPSTHVYGSLIADDTVAIGTTEPTQTLDVRGTAYIEDDDQNFLAVGIFHDTIAGLIPIQVNGTVIGKRVGDWRYYTQTGSNNLSNSIVSSFITFNALTGESYAVNTDSLGIRMEASNILIPNAGNSIRAHLDNIYIILGYDTDSDLIVQDSLRNIIFKVAQSGQLSIIDGSQADGYVLTSDASGNATWQAASGGGASFGDESWVQYSDGAGGFLADAQFFRNDTITEIAYTLGDTTNKITLKSYRESGSPFNEISLLQTWGENGDATGLALSGGGMGFYTYNSTGNYDCSFYPGQLSLKVGDADGDTSIAVAIDTLGVLFRTDYSSYYFPQDTGSVGQILTVVTNEGAGTAMLGWQDASALDFSNVPSYADNATAVGVLGEGKLYYTDTAGEHILKITH